MTIRNAGRQVQHYAACVVGLPDAGLSASEPELTKLRPGEDNTVRTSIEVPAQRGLPAGEYVLGILVTSPYDTTNSRCEELELEVTPAPALTAAVAPDLVSGGPRHCMS